MRADQSHGSLLDGIRRVAQDSSRFPIVRTFADELRQGLLGDARDWLVQVFPKALGLEMLAGQ